MNKVKSNKKKFTVRKKHRVLLEEIASSSQTTSRTLKRVQILLSKHFGHSHSRVAAIVGTSIRTISSVLARYRAKGLERALYDVQRPGAAFLLTPAQNERVIAVACTDPPKGFSRWTIALLVDAVKKKNIVASVGRETIRKTLLSHDMKPWKKKMWCVPKLDDEYIERMEDVLNVYQRKYNPAYPVVCMDEKPIQLLNDARSPIKAIPGHPHKQDYEYKRMGTANLFAAIEPLTGDMTLSATPDRKGYSFALYIEELSKKYKDAKKIHLVFDNLRTHSKKSLIDYFGNVKGKRIWKRFIIHRTPKHASWLNQAEMAISLVSRQCLGKDRIGTLKKLSSRVNYYRRNRKTIAIQWKFTTEKARKVFGYNRKKSNG